MFLRGPHNIGRTSKIFHRIVTDHASPIKHEPLSSRLTLGENGSEENEEDCCKLFFGQLLTILNLFINKRNIQ